MSTHVIQPHLKESERGAYDFDLGSGQQALSGAPKTLNEKSHLHGNRIDPSAGMDTGNAHTATVTGTRRWRKFRYIEPAFILFMIGYFSVKPLKNQFVYTNLLFDAINTVNEVNPMDKPTYGSISHKLTYGKPVRKDLLPPGFLNYSHTEEERMNRTEQHGRNGSSTATLEKNFYPENFWDHVKEKSSHTVLFLDLLSGLFAMIMNPVICAYTDIAGRRFGMALPAIGMLLELIVYLTVTYLRLPIICLAIGHVLEGFCGSAPALVGVSYAYLADTAQRKRRTFRFVALNAVFLLSFMIGTLSVGVIIEVLGFTTALWMITSLLGLSFLYTLIFLEESIVDSRMHFSIRKLFKSTKDAFSIYIVQRVENGRIKLAVLLLISFLQALMLLGIGDLFVLYLIGPPFSFSSLKIGAFLSEYALMNALGPLLAIGVFRSQVKDVSIAMFASVLSAFGFVLFSFLPASDIVYIVPPLLCMSTAFAPLVRAMMSKIVTENEQGHLQATISFLDSLGDLGGAPLHLAIFSATLAFFPGLVFLLVAGLMLVLLLLLAYVRKLTTETEEHTPLKPENFTNTST